MNDPYQPTTFDEIVGQPTDQIEALLDGEHTDNFLFYGPPGTGKTATARVISRRLQGSASELMEFNSSDERGIDTVRDEIIPVTDQTTLTGAPRVIFLDEMDAMTKSAQEALRAPMEQSSAVFILACNEVHAVHDAVRSRCQPFEYGTLEDGAIEKRINQIADAEGVDLSDGHRQMIVSFAAGDMRQALKRYTQVARGAIAAEEEQVEIDSSDLESRAQDFLSE